MIGCSNHRTKKVKKKTQKIKRQIEIALLL
jgi:hypothetical protein